jgi:hypothetical protein
MLKALLVSLLFCSPLFAAGKVLIIADEVPAMEFLSGKLKAGAAVESTIVTQDKLPPDFGPYSSVIVYIHGKLLVPTETACVNYATGGGKLILLHHSISSSKRANKQWFPTLGISLPEGDVSQGGYKWIEPVTLEFVNLAPKHYITTHNVKYQKRIPYQRSDVEGGERQLDGFTLPDTEVYLNHTFTGPRTILLGMKYTDAKSGITYMQDRAGWYKPAGKGWVMYFMAGHSVRDLENPAYAQILVNAVAYQPKL